MMWRSFRPRRDGIQEGKERNKRIGIFLPTRKLTIHHHPPKKNKNPLLPQPSSPLSHLIFQCLVLLVRHRDGEPIVPLQLCQKFATHDGKGKEPYGEKALDQHPRFPQRFGVSASGALATVPRP